MTLIRVLKYGMLQPFLLNRNLVLRFAKGGGSTRNDEGYMGRGDQRISE
jgi:hypothetical protein